MDGQERYLAMVKVKDGRYFPTSIEEIVITVLAHANEMTPGDRQLLLEKLQGAQADMIADALIDVMSLGDYPPYAPGSEEALAYRHAILDVLDLLTKKRGWDLKGGNDETN